MFTEYIQPACIPNRHDILEVGSTVWVTGWGETYSESFLLIKNRY